MFDNRLKSGVVSGFLLIALMMSCTPEKTMQIRNASGQKVKLQLHNLNCSPYPFITDEAKNEIILLNPGYDSTFAIGTGGWSYSERIGLEECIETSLQVAPGESAENRPHLIVNAFGYKDNELTVVFE